MSVPPLSPLHEQPFLAISLSYAPPLPLITAKDFFLRGGKSFSSFGAVVTPFGQVIFFPPLTGLFSSSSLFYSNALFLQLLSESRPYGWVHQGNYFKRCLPAPLFVSEQFPNCSFNLSFFWTFGPRNIHSLGQCAFPSGSPLCCSFIETSTDFVRPHTPTRN